MAWAARDVRETFLSFFEERGHTRVASSSLVPENDATLLFVNSGMVPFKRALTGEEKRAYTRAVSTQKCMRVSGKHNDLEEVGRSARHHTFFEMLGNFSFGDYFKHDAIRLAWELITEHYRIDPADLVVSVFREDDEAAEIWEREIGRRSRWSTAGSCSLPSIGERSPDFTRCPITPNYVNLPRGGIRPVPGPAEGVARCRAAWERLAGRQTCVVQGDTNPGNVRITSSRVALIDWDEAHVDVADLDLVLPHNAAGLDDDAHDIAAQASAAWEAAVCWDDEYAIRRLAEVRAI